MIPGDWTLRAACRGLDTERFYPSEGERDPSRARRETRAKAVCNGSPSRPACAVRLDCLEWALASGDGFAVLGGTTPDERVGRSRGTPRVDPARVGEVDRMTRDGLSSREIGARLGMAQRVVVRYRARAREAS